MKPHALREARPKAPREARAAGSRSAAARRSRPAAGGADARDPYPYVLGAARPSSSGAVRPLRTLDEIAARVGTLISGAQPARDAARQGSAARAKRARRGD